PLPLNATLSDRLTAFRTAPGAGWEPATFVKWNLETCSNVVPNHNKDLLAKSTLVWASLNSSEIMGHREKMAGFLEQKEREGAFHDPVHVSEGGKGLVGRGRGIVFTAGNADTLSRVITALRLIRHHHHCHLPALIFHFPSEAPPKDSSLRSDLALLNAKLVAATGRARDPSRQKNYHLKAQSIVDAPFSEVLYLDSDNLPADNPELLFDMLNYKRLGVYFTPDYWKTSASNPIWQIMGVQCRDEWEQEAGQIVVDKTRHLDAMLLSLYMLVDWEWWFYFSDGDKDVFRFAFLSLRKRWALPGRYVGGGGLPRGTLSGDFCAHTMQQYDNAGKPFFVHYNLLKQIPSGVYRGFTWGRTKQVKAYPEPSIPVEEGLTKDEKMKKNPLKPHTPSQNPHYPPYPDPTIRGPTDVEADMLANADDEGRAIYTGNEEVRRRAALERGIRPYFHGGGNSAFCIDMRWEDPEPKRERIRVFKDVKEGEDKKDGEDKKGRWVGGQEVGIDWSENPLEIAQWSDDPRLRQFEDVMYDLGFQPSGVGF
ncbi:glycosyltransferase family 71 protein, partial [Sphaerobolus stellatus SS14]